MMLNKNKVELVGHYGGDVQHACSAWTSTDAELTEEKRERIPEMLRTLAVNGHHTPFEKSALHFIITTDIATHIHLLKHRISVSVNAESARYKELKEDRFYSPLDWEGLVGIHDDWPTLLKNFNEEGNRLYHLAIQELSPILGRKRAKESARFFKTYSSQITSDVMFNWRSFAHFYKLRGDLAAQLEVRELANQMLSEIEKIPGAPFEHTIKAFGF